MFSPVRNPPPPLSPRGRGGGASFGDSLPRGWGIPTIQGAGGGTGAEAVLAACAPLCMSVIPTLVQAPGQVATHLLAFHNIEIDQLPEVIDADIWIPMEPAGRLHAVLTTSEVHKSKPGPESELNAAATRIQALFRGHEVRKGERGPEAIAGHPLPADGRGGAPAPGGPGGGHPPATGGGAVPHTGGKAQAAIAELHALENQLNSLLAAVASDAEGRQVKVREVVGALSNADKLPAPQEMVAVARPGPPAHAPARCGAVGHVGGAMASVRARAILKNPRCFVVKDSPQGPATANRQPKPTANRQLRACCAVGCGLWSHGVGKGGFPVRVALSVTIRWSRCWTLKLVPAVTPPPPPVIFLKQRGRSCRGTGAGRTLGTSGDPPGDICTDQAAFGKDQQSLATITKRPRKTGLVLATTLFEGSMGHLGATVHRRWAADRCRGADAGRGRRTDTPHERQSDSV